MGRDKALIEIDGVPMVVRVATALRAAGCDPVFAVGGDQDALESLGLRFVADEFPGDGPVGGVIAALEASETQSVVVVACDLPYLTADTVRTMMVAGDAFDAAIAYTGRLQPLCVLWSQSALGRVREAFGAGERRVKAVLEMLETLQIPANPQDLANVNAPGDLPQ